MDLKIIEPITKCLETFKSPQEFTLYYNKNRNEMNSMTTQKLNKSYHIDGYRITKIKGELCLKAAKEKPKVVEEMKGIQGEAHLLNRIAELEKANSNIMDHIKTLTDALNQVINQLNQDEK